MSYTGRIDIAAYAWWRAGLNGRWELNPGRVFNAIGAASC